MKGKKLSVKERIAKAEQDKQERIKIFKELISHISTGYSLDCFGPLSDKSIGYFLKTYPQEFVQEELDNAMRDGKNYWENIGHRQAQGSCLGNSRTWYYNMANRFGWREKIDIEAEHKGSVNINVVSYATRKDSTDKPEH